MKRFLPILVIGLSSTVWAEEKTKAASEWGVDERLSARFDPASAKARRERFGIHEEAINVVDGKQNPELLLPSEIFRDLVGLAILSENAPFREHFREKFARGAKQVGLRGDLLAALDAQTVDYAAVRKERRRLGTRVAGDSVGELRASTVTECALAAKALASMRRNFGKAEFDRFLYEVVAPEITIRSDATQDSLRAMEGGCR
ncbi:MAG TPA: hypothetical protein VIZ69_13690 [Thermoanaerobaculia bacterium]